MNEIRIVFGYVLVILICTTTIGFAQEPTTKKRKTAAPAKFKQWDQNADGVVSVSELPQSHQASFDEADLNADGGLSTHEFGKYWRDHGRKVAARESMPDDVTIFEDLAYVENGHVRQKLDIYLPKTAEASGPVPLVVWIHGGGWKNGSKSGLVGQQALLKNGFALASINYRLVSHAPFPAQIHDCKSAIRFLRDNADQYGFDSEKIGVWGSSAGGHLAALLGTTNGMHELESEGSQDATSSHVSAVCEYFGPSNMTTIVQPIDPNDPLDRKRVKLANANIGNLLGGPVNDNPELAKLASPIQHVSADDVPFLIIHGDADPIVPLNQSTTFHQKLLEAGVASELVIVPDGIHSFYGSDEHLTRVVNFFRKTLSK